MITAKEIEAQFTTLDSDGNVVAFDFDSFNALVTELYKDRTTIRASNEEEIKAQKNAENAKLAEIGKAYYKSLKVGDEFSYKDSKGKTWKGRKIETKSGTDSTAACELLELPEGSKKAARYPKFHTVVVPAEFAETYNAKKAEEAVA